MTQISVWFVRSSLLHFAVGATAGAWQLAALGGPWPRIPLSLRPVHVEVMLFGWVCQLALGVALWILPFSRSVSEDRRFWTAGTALNAGILLVVVGTWSGAAGLLLVGRACQSTAAGLLIWGLWPRLPPLRQHGQ